jgi:REP element-mobilizing transposase RayT
LFEQPSDYQAFEVVIRETLDESPMRICSYAVMPNRWHLLLSPERDGELAAFIQRLTITHVRRWQQHRGYAGLGHVYQGWGGLAWRSCARVACSAGSLPRVERSCERRLRG